MDEVSGISGGSLEWNAPQGCSFQLPVFLHWLLSCHSVFLFALQRPICRGCNSKWLSWVQPTHWSHNPLLVSAVRGASYHLSQGAHLPKADFSWLGKRICMWIGLFRHTTCRVKSSSKPPYSSSLNALLVISNLYTLPTFYGYFSYNF